MSAKRKVILKKLKDHKTIWHPESKLVFKSQKERIVVGMLEDGEIIPLNESMLNLCDQWKFKPDESVLGIDDSDEHSNDSDDNSDSEQTDPPDDHVTTEASTNDDTEQDVTSERKEQEHTNENSKTFTDAAARTVIASDFTRASVNISKLCEYYEKTVVELQAALNVKADELSTLQVKYDSVSNKMNTLKELLG